MCSFCLISPATINLQSCDIFQMKGDIQRYVMSTNSFLSDIGELRYRQNNIGYQIIKIVKYRLISYLQNCIVLPISRLPNIAQRTACTQNVPINVTFHLSTNSLLCIIEEPSYRQNNKGYQILRKGYQYTFDHFDNLIPVLFCLYLSSPILLRKLCVLRTHLGM